MKSWTAAIVAGLVACALVSAAQAEIYVYPKPGQSQDAFRSDQYECHNWAKQQTGFDPAHRRRPPPRRRHSRAARCKGAARGAAVGRRRRRHRRRCRQGCSGGRRRRRHLGRDETEPQQPRVGASLPAGTVPAAGPPTATTRRPTRRAWQGVDIRSSRALALGCADRRPAPAGACATPIGVSLSGPKEIHRAVTRSVLTNGQPSAATEQFLHRLGLAERFDKDPGGHARTSSAARAPGSAATASSRWPSSPSSTPSRKTVRTTTWRPPSTPMRSCSGRTARSTIPSIRAHGSPPISTTSVWAWRSRRRRAGRDWTTARRHRVAPRLKRRRPKSH